MRTSNPLGKPATQPGWAFWPALAVLLATAAAIRWGRLPVAWSYWAIDYASYPYPFRLDLADGLVPWTRLSGLHPGQHALLSAAILALGGTIRDLLALALALSLGSILAGALWLRDRAGAAAGLAFATAAGLSPYLAHYGPELNNYPLLLAGGAATTGLFSAGWDRERRSWVAASGLALAATTALHAHLGAVPLVMLLAALALAGRRWHLLGALALGLLLASPVLLAAWGLAGMATTFHNEAVPLTELPSRLLRLFAARFGGTGALASICASTVLATAVALRDGRGRGPALLLLALAATGTSTIVLGMTRGAAFVGQTPYWVFVSWCLLALLGLGFGVAGRRARAAIGLLLAPWLLLSSVRAALPAAGTPVPADLGEPSALRTWIDSAFLPGDVLVWLWDPRHLNDEPRRTDPVFAALRPGDIGDWLGRDRPFPGFGHEFRGGEAYFVASTCTRRDEHEQALADALLSWVREGRRVHVVVAWVDPERGTFDPSRLRQAALGAGALWREGWAHRTRVITVEPARH